jgi:hypothetical protein
LVYGTDVVLPQQYARAFIHVAEQVFQDYQKDMSVTTARIRSGLPGAPEKFGAAKGKS